MFQFKAKYSKLLNYPVCLGNISKDFSVNNMKQIELNGYVYDFSVDLGTTDVNGILDIHK